MPRKAQRGKQQTPFRLGWTEQSREKDRKVFFFSLFIEHTFDRADRVCEKIHNLDRRTLLKN